VLAVVFFNLAVLDGAKRTTAPKAVKRGYVKGRMVPNVTFLANIRAFFRKPTSKQKKKTNYPPFKLLFAYLIAWAIK
jgi:hypothetical protein